MWKRPKKPHTPCHWRQVGPSLHLDKSGDPARPPYARYRLFRGPDEERDDDDEDREPMDVSELPEVRRDAAAQGGEKEEGEMATTKKRTTKRAGAVTGSRSTENAVVHASDETFEREVGTADVPVLVDFSASWCGPCQRLAQVLPAIAAKFTGKVKVVKVDVDESPKSAAHYVDEGVPTLVVFKRGKPVAVDCGFGTRRETEAWLEAALKRAEKPSSKKPRRPTCCCG
jgi:thioredoxin